MITETRDDDAPPRGDDGIGHGWGALPPGPSTSLSQVAPSALQTAEITVGGVPLTVELAYLPADRSLGLGYREGLAPDTGMLFLFAGPAPRSFWMRGMQF